MSDSQWYVLKVISGQEKKVKAYIEAERTEQQLEDCIEQVLIPSERVYEMRAGKRQTKERQFFPGYVLICATLTDGRANHIIRSIPGALGFLSTRGWSLSKAPVPMRQAEINRILGKVDDAFTEGELVKVIDGPFSGFTGSIQEIFEERKKLNVTVKIFERNTPVELSYAQVEKLP